MQLTNIGTIKELLSRHGFSFSKSLGQNFLINPSVCPRIVENGIAYSKKKAIPNTQDNEEIYALEIGAGIGVLTKELALRCKKVVSVEIDERLRSVLQETLCDYDNVELVYADVLKLNLSTLINEKFPDKNSSGNKPKIICCANLPYYITSPVLMKLLEDRLPLNTITVMVQKEAAERICAVPGSRECGAISAAVRYYSVPEKLFNVSRGSFIPAPNVDSSVIRLNVHNVNPYVIDDEALFFNIIKSAFSQRRKQAVNPLSESFGISKDVLKDIFIKNKIKPSARAEEFKMNDFFSIYNEIQNLKRNG